MIKKVLKAMILGLRESMFFVLLATAIFLGWLPMIVIIILKVFNINLNGEEFAMTIFIAMILGIAIFSYVTHCIDAVKYQEKRKCSFQTAWSATIRDDES